MNAAYTPGLSSVPGVPAADSTAAGHSLGEAYQVADRLGGASGGALRQAARDSFVHGLHVTLLVSAGLLLLGAVMALRLPRVMDCGAPTTDSAPGAYSGRAENAGPAEDGSGTDSAPGPAGIPSPRDITGTRVSA